MLAHADEVLNRSRVYVARGELLGAMALSYAAKFGYDSVEELLRPKPDESTLTKRGRALATQLTAVCTESSAHRNKVIMDAMRSTLVPASTRSTMCTYQLTALLNKRGEFLRAGGGGGGSSEDTAVEFDKLADTVVTFATLIGMEAEQRAMRCKFVYPLQYPSAFTGLSRGVLMYGPPGTGKTQLARACANELGASDAASCVVFRSTTAATMKGKYVGETEKNIRNVFAAMSAEITAREKTTGRSPGVGVLFIDEVDTVAGQRGGEDKTMALSVNALLQAMDGAASDKRISVMAATNLLGSLDAAFLSRMDTKIEIGMPTWQDQRKLLLQNMFSWINGNDMALPANTHRECTVSEPHTWVGHWDGETDGTWLVSHAWAFTETPIITAPEVEEVRTNQFRRIADTVNRLFKECGEIVGPKATLKLTDTSDLPRNSSVGGTADTLPWPLFGLAHRDGGSLYRMYVTETALRALTWEGRSLDDSKTPEKRVFLRKYRNCGVYYAATLEPTDNEGIESICENVFDDSKFTGEAPDEEIMGLCPFPAVYSGRTSSEIGYVMTLQTDNFAKESITAVEISAMEIGKTGKVRCTRNRTSTELNLNNYWQACGMHNTKTKKSFIAFNIKWVGANYPAIGSYIRDRMRVMTIDVEAFDIATADMIEYNTKEQQRRREKEKVRVAREDK